MNHQELLRRALDLSLAIYRITAKLPEGEVLVGQMRELGNRVAAELSAAYVELSSAAGELDNLKKHIASLRVYFKIAKAQNWVKEINWSILDFEYYKLEQELMFCESARMGELTSKHELEKDKIITSHNIEESPKKTRKPVHRSAANLPLRQDRILKVVQNKSIVKISDLIPLFKDDISERTLRNELRELVRGGLIRKKGANKSTEYYAG